MRPLLLLAVLAVPALIAAAPSPAPEKTPGQPADAATLWKAHCARCHGLRGTADATWAKKGVPDLADPDWQKERTDADIQKLIAEGSPGTQMEPFKDKLTAAQIKALTAHIRTLRPKS